MLKMIASGRQWMQSELDFYLIKTDLGNEKEKIQTHTRTHTLSFNENSIFHKSVSTLTNSKTC